MKKHIMLFITGLISLWVNGQVGINTDKPNASAGLHISERKDPTSATPDKFNGLIIQRYTTAERDANFILGTLEEGLTIYNTDEKCYNYYQSASQQWLSLCGTLAPAVYTVDCSQIKVFGTYTEGTALNNTNYVRLPVTVTKTGAYHIVGKTANGYYFEESGVFSNTGTFMITLNGFGAPIAPTPVPGDQLVMVYNERQDDSCTKYINPIKGKTVSYDIVCDGISVNGTYLTGAVLDPVSNTVTIPISVETIGQIAITTTSNNGISFSSNETITTSSDHITLQGVGTPQKVGKYTFTFSTNGANVQTCSFTITFDTTLGTFTDPVDRCSQIYELGKMVDGEYWIKNSASDATPVKTVCDMTHGGYTLLWSFSEKTLYTGGNTIYGIVNNMKLSAGLSTDSVQNSVTTESGTIVYENHRLANATMLNVRSTNPGDYRVNITDNPKDPKDIWSNSNYFNAKPRSSSYDYISSVGVSTCTGSNVPTTGKLFGYIYNGTTNTQQYNGVNSGNVCPYINNGGYGSHWDAGNRMNGLITAPDGTSINANQYNNLFGFFGETEVNHHFGKCTADDNSFATVRCSSGNLTPHSFNSGQGRYLQWWVK
ncbi:hypothetical protein [Chryseobacterium sp. Mn2064]|uniref:hypothetical protein n=1 Tax=Chryseobacterium sp. Mn2064 TaxID=3395263 RepID=UPI003BE24749